MYHVIESLQTKMSKNKDLFGNVTIELNLKDIVDDNHYSRTMSALKELMRKPISYYYNRNQEIYDVTTVLIYAIRHRRNTSSIEIKIPEEAVPTLLYIGEGFTLYNKNIALSLDSIYAKRIYELCCRWKDKGFFRLPLREFRMMLCVEDKFKQISELKKNVLDLSEKILREHADISYSYVLKKEDGSRAFNWLELTIYRKGENPKDKAQERAYIYVYNFLYSVFRNSRAMDETERLLLSGKIKQVADRLRRLDKDINSGKVKKHGQKAYVNAVLLREFEIATPEDKKKTSRISKREKASAGMGDLFPSEEKND
jgi:plasmid replication initiation protein